MPVERRAHRKDPASRARPTPGARRQPFAGDSITLGQLLKLAGVVQSGGAAKALLAGGQVRVNGQPEARRGRKLRAGDRVDIPGSPALVLSREERP